MIRGVEDFLKENAKSAGESLLQKLTTLVSIQNVKEFSAVKKVDLNKYAPVLETAFAEALRDYKEREFNKTQYDINSPVLSYNAFARMNTELIDERFVKTILKNSLIADKFEEAFSLMKKIDWKNLQLYANCYQDCYRIMGAIFRTTTRIRSSSNKSSREEITACITFLHEIGFAKEKLTEEAKKSLMNEIRYLEDRQRREEIIDFYREIYPEMVKDLRGMQTGDKTGIT